MTEYIDKKVFRNNLEVDCYGRTDIVKVGIAMDKAKVEPIQTWIPVTERLPEVECYTYSTDVLFHVPNGNIFVGYVNFETGTWKCLHSRELFAADKVTHWMPMPEPPKE